jgi:hypothetical protein
MWNNVTDGQKSECGVATGTPRQVEGDKKEDRDINRRPVETCRGGILLGMEKAGAVDA